MVSTVICIVYIATLVAWIWYAFSGKPGHLVTKQAATSLELKVENDSLRDQLVKAKKRVTFYQRRHREIVKAASEIQGLAEKVELEDETGFTEEEGDEPDEEEQAMILAFKSQDPYGGNFS